MELSLIMQYDKGVNWINYLLISFWQCLYIIVFKLLYISNQRQCTYIHQFVIMFWYYVNFFDSILFIEILEYGPHVRHEGDFLRFLLKLFEILLMRLHHFQQKWYCFDINIIIFILNSFAYHRKKRHKNALSICFVNFLEGKFMKTFIQIFKCFFAMFRIFWI